MKFPTSVRDHHARVRRLCCVVTDRPDVTLHHAHGASVNRRLSEMGLDATKGMGRRGFGEALVIPLALEYHSLDGVGIDANIGRARWEELFGTQAAHLDAVGALLGYDLWILHKLWLPLKATFRPNTSTF